MMVVRTVAWLVLSTLVVSIGSDQARSQSTDSATLRRTPTVEIFSQYHDSVVFVTGGIHKSREPSLDQFFALNEKGPDEQSIGTGFVIHADGYILTNAHGIEKLVTPEVVLADDRRVQAEVVGCRIQNDLAVLKIQTGKRLKPVRFARSGDLLIGETVIVIGHPHGLRHTCTTGVLSATERNTDVTDLKMTLRGLIQTDAGINPGSSGGPWFNVLGEVMGITASKKGEADDIAFAVPCDTIRRDVPGMLDVEARAGFSIGLSLPADGPCSIQTVRPASPASAAGLRVGDVIEHWGNTATPTVLDYHLALLDSRLGQPVRVRGLRQAEPLDTVVTPKASPRVDPAPVILKKLGLAVAPLQPKQAEQMRLRVAEAVVITRVDAERYRGVDHAPDPGDLLGRINKIRPRDPDHLARLVRQIQPTDPVTMVVLRYRDKVATRLDIKIAMPK